jgi:GTP-binding protein
MPDSKIRNIAIIAHVDHGKTTLVDQLLRQSGTFRENQQIAERVMDSMDLEREKGITIRAKNASIKWRDYHINLVDTPGHADFGGEVERIMQMIDGVLLVVDAWEGAQAQTKFVTKKALAAGAQPIIVINKIDRPNADPHKVLDEVFDLFLELEANDQQLDFPIIYASGLNGYAVREWKGQVTDEIKNAGMTALFETIIQKIPPPRVDVEDAPFRMVVANLDYNDFVGRIAYGKIFGGSIKLGDPIVCLRSDGSRLKGKTTAIFGYDGLKQVQIEKSSAGQIVGIAGIEEVFIGDTLADREDREPLPVIAIDPPTIRMQFIVNDSPLAGREGKFLTARHIRERLIRETRGNVGIQVADTDTAGAFEVCARGQMQIAVIVEQMRREGFELMVSPPEVIMKKNEEGQTIEPFENLYIDIAPEYLGDVLQNLAARRCEVTNMHHRTHSITIEAIGPTRGIIGIETDLLNLTKGTGILSHLFREYRPHVGEIETRKTGVLIALEQGETTAYALSALQERGKLFVGPGEEVYAGMIVGENPRNEDLVVNPCKAKALTNMRSQGEGKGIQLEPPVKMSLERCLEYLAPDEYLEVTPSHLRLRKRILDHTKRRRLEKTASA